MCVYSEQNERTKKGEEDASKIAKMIRVQYFFCLHINAIDCSVVLWLSSITVQCMLKKMFDFGCFSKWTGFNKN